MSYLSSRTLRKSCRSAIVGVALLVSFTAFADKIDVNAPADKDRLIREITTPSPPKSVWEHLSLVLNWARGKPYDDTIRILQEYFKSLPAPANSELAQFKDKVRHEFVFVKGGKFLMGDFGPEHSKEKLPYSANDGASPAHPVVLDSYSILKHRVTYADFDLYTRANHLDPIGIRNGHELEFRFPDYPVAQVTWQEASDFCSWAGRITGLPLGLPTEAQWEYAARSRGELWVIPSPEIQAVDGKYNVEQLDDTVVRMENNGTSPEPMISRPVGTYGDNKLGVSDVFGRGKEWTYDWFDKDYYSHSPQHDPRGPEQGTLRSVRFGTDGNTQLVIDRTGMAPDTTDATVGFRCVANQTEPVAQ
jgi:formylglycine-generating enzyme required for sulfatase activity